MLCFKLWMKTKVRSTKLFAIGAVFTFQLISRIFQDVLTYCKLDNFLLLLVTNMKECCYGTQQPCATTDHHIQNSKKTNFM